MKTAAIIRNFIFVFFVLLFSSFSFENTAQAAAVIAQMNLEFSELRIEPEHPQEGDSITIHYTVRGVPNLSECIAGIGSASDMYITAVQDNSSARAQVQISTQTLLEGRAISGSMTLQSNGQAYRVRPGHDILRVVLDSEHGFAETNENDNNRIFQLDPAPNDIQRPDLIVTSFENITQDHRESYERNATLFFRVRVRNANYRLPENVHQPALANVRVQVSDGHGWSGEALIPNLEEEADIQVSLRTQNAALGRKTMTAVVDPSTQIQEANEQNNSRLLETPLQIIADDDTFPHLSITGFEFNPANPLIRQPVTITVSVRNTGTGDLDANPGSYVNLICWANQAGLRERRDASWTDNTQITQMRVNETRRFTFRGYVPTVPGTSGVTGMFTVSDGGIGQRVEFDAWHTLEGIEYNGTHPGSFEVRESDNVNLPEFAIIGTSIANANQFTRLGDRGFAVEADQEIQFTVTVAQSNSAYALNNPDSFSVRVNATNGSGWSAHRTAEFPLIDNNNRAVHDMGTTQATVTFSLRGQELAEGENTFTFTVNPDNNPRESSAINNTYTQGSFIRIQRIMPDLRGLSPVEARQVLYRNFIQQASVVPNPTPVPSWQFDPGVIVNQNIPAGRAVQNELRVEVDVAGSLQMPNFVGEQSSAAVRYFVDEIHFPTRPTFVDDYAPNTPGELNDILVQDPAPGRTLRQGTPISFRLKKGRSLMPNVRNLYEDEAKRLITAQGWVADIPVRYEKSFNIERTRVIRQSPEVNTPLEANTAVELLVSEGAPVMPNLAGQTKEQARARLRNAGWNAAAIETEAFALNVGTVISQEPAANTVLAANSRVAFAIGKPIVMPNVMGQDILIAQTKIVDAGYTGRFTVTENQQIQDEARSGEVTAQNPAAGTIINAALQNSVSLEHIHKVSASDKEKQKKDQQNSTIQPSDTPLQAPVIGEPVYSLDNHIRGSYNASYVDAFVELNINDRNNVVQPRAVNNGLFDIFMNDQFVLEGQRITVTLRAKNNQASPEQRAISREVVVQRAAPLTAPVITAPVLAGERNIRATYRAEYLDASFTLYINGRSVAQGVRGQNGRAEIALPANVSLSEGDRIRLTMFARRDVRVQLSSVNSEEVTIEAPRPLAIPTITGPLLDGDTFVRGTYRRDYYDPQITIQVDGRNVAGDPAQGVSGQYTSRRLNRALRGGQEVVAVLRARQHPGGLVQEALSQPMTVRDNLAVVQKKSVEAAKAAPKKTDSFQSEAEESPFGNSPAPRYSFSRASGNSKSAEE